MAIIRHVSDAHGYFPEATQSFDFTVISGDICYENYDTWYGSDFRNKIALQQENWVKHNKQRLIDWSQGKPTYYIHGNHDRLNESILSSELGWININNSFSNLDGYSVYGFPWIPYICGLFNYECDDSEMRHKIHNMIFKFNGEGFPDILVTHAPLHGIMDGVQKYGCRNLLNMFNYSFTEDEMPRLLLHGHIHESKGVQLHTFANTNVTVSNAATGCNYLEI